MLLRKTILLPLLLVLLTALGAVAQILTPTKLSAAVSQPAAKVGEEIDLIVNARIDDKWHLYATDFDPDLGPVPFTFSFTKSSAYELVGPPKSVGSQKHFDEIFKGDVTYFVKTGQIKQRIRLLQPGALTIKADVEFQSCTDVDGRCIPGEEALSFGPLQVTGTAIAPTATPATGPAAPPKTPDGAALTPEAPATAAASPDTAAPAAAIVAPDSAAAVRAAAMEPADDAGAAAGPAEPEKEGLWAFAFGAFLFGLGALITPCVFPLIPMTVSYFTSGSDSRQRGIFKAVVYGLSIIFIYVVVGLLVTVLLGADGLNLISTHWLPNLIFFAVFVVFGLSFLGLFEITLPHGMVNKIDAQADKGGWGGVFFMALTLVVVSFSCTGPIVATILTMAAQGQRLTPIIGMLGFSLAFALPFTLFAIFPAWLKSLPRSGGWLNTVKVVLGFVELMLALKFLSMADLAYHWNLLPRDIYLVLWIALSGLLGLYLLGRFKLSHDSDLTHLSVGRLLMAVLAFSFMTYLVPGLFGAPLPLLAGYLPPQSRNDFSLSAGAGLPAALPDTQCEAPRYGEFLELPHGLQGFFDLEQAQRCAKAQNKPIFIDFTGHACVNCRKMEATVWKDPQVLKRLRDDFVVVALYVDDKAPLPKSEWYTSTFDNKEKTTLGKKNADLQLSGFNVNAQPYYVLLDPNAPADLQHVLTTPIAYEPDVEAFVKFLDNGLARFRQQQAAAGK
ncbi:protein-disulfide reductase DsbD family protein [Hymenobacter psychrotolerans]|uniref:Thiol:disulfide interchange protein DsbD n=1 Tax=Hymenobacter psychrotolerans DSM 18569 TaxID=1121959 RepID=A0A1M6S4S8_9BACT|nr:thioredoxin family protein [Hymenobacter psychrotolerans]SHK39517.1 thiol:disulfide interchange protein DsbD [Hymenobacter psychrotolerans DSM 18569]